MRDLPLPVFIIGAIAFLIIAGLVWNYTEAIKAENVVEQERALSEEKLQEEQMYRKRAEDQVRILEQMVDEKNDQEATQEEERRNSYKDCVDTAEKRYQDSIAEQKSEDLQRWGNLILGKSYGDAEKLNREIAVCDRLYGN